MGGISNSINNKLVLDTFDSAHFLFSSSPACPGEALLMVRPALAQSVG